MAGEIQPAITISEKQLNGDGLSHLCSTIKSNLASKQDTLTAGANITITNSVISASSDLPTINSGDAGKVLAVNSGETGTEWITPASGGGDLKVFTYAYIDGNYSKSLSAPSGDFATWIANQGYKTDKNVLIATSDNTTILRYVGYGYTSLYDCLYFTGTTNIEFNTISIPNGAKRKDAVIQIKQTDHTFRSGKMSVCEYALKSEIPDGLPTISSGDAGKVLTVNNGETGVEWGTVSGGGSYTAGDGIDITNNVISSIDGCPVLDLTLNGTNINVNSGNVWKSNKDLRDFARMLYQTKKTGQIFRLLSGSILKYKITTLPMTNSNLPDGAIRAILEMDMYNSCFKDGSNGITPFIKIITNIDANAETDITTYINNESEIYYGLRYSPVRYNDSTNYPSTNIGSNLGAFLDSIKNNYAKKSELPSTAQKVPTISSGDAGKVLAVNSGETGVEWITVASGGSSYTAGTGISITNGVISLDLSNAESESF